MTEASVLGTRYRIGCSCSCGWQTRVEQTGQGGALADAAAARVAHLETAHPRQTPSSWWRPRAAARYRHPRSLSAATRVEGTAHTWRRDVACACGWHQAVAGRSADGAARQARHRHRSHVLLQTGRAPGRDYLVGIAMSLVAVCVIAAAALLVVDASGGETSRLISVLR